MRLPKKTEVVACIVLALFFAYFWGVARYTEHTYLFDNDFYKLMVISISSIIGLFAVWRVFMRGRPVGQKNTWLFSVFFCVTGSATIILWNVPEAIMVASAHEEVSNIYNFRMVYPGPSCGKSCTCKAGVIYYDTYLKREIEFCQNDDSSFFYTDYMRVDKLISDMGGKILSHKAIH